METATRADGIRYTITYGTAARNWICSARGMGTFPWYFQTSTTWVMSNLNQYG